MPPPVPPCLRQQVFGLARLDQLFTQLLAQGAHHDAAMGNGVFAVDLGCFAPACLEDGWVNEFGANVCFAELLLINACLRHANSL